MPRCEDYPCCGHTLEDGCPDPDAADRDEYPYPCVECGGRIKIGEARRGHESFHSVCLDRYLQSQDEDWGEY